MISNKIIAKEFIMELVYLWVEDYKNIQKQGFNFSPRFRCEYDEKTNELTIDENKDYVSIFPDNINITAIVGENGSGKSSLIKAIDTILMYQKLIFFNNTLYFTFEKYKIKNNTKYKHKKDKFFFDNILFMNKNFFFNTLNDRLLDRILLDRSNLYLNYFSVSKN